MKRFRILAASTALAAALVVPVAVTPAAPAHAFPTIVIPTCSQMFDKSAWMTLFPTGMRLTSDTVRTGASNARQAAIINGQPHRNCTWTNALGTRSITVSVAWILIEQEREIRSWYAANGIPLVSIGGSDPDYAFVPHKSPRVEMHLTDDMFFVAIDDRGFGSLGASMQEVHENLVELNPWMLTI